MMTPLLAAVLALGPAETTAQTLAADPAIPAAAVSIVRCGAVDAASAGVRRAGQIDPVAPADRFNIGSNAKSMLATLAAVLVERGDLSWTDTIGASPAFAGVDIHAGLRDATLAELLNHTAGVAAYASGVELNALFFDGPPAVQRQAFAETALTAPPAGPRGAYLYSNAGYVIAARMIEAATQADFFALMQTDLFAPLSVDAHLGEPASVGPNQPLGHTASEDGPQPLADDQEAIPAFLDPAGDVSLSAADYARYVELHVCGLGGAETALLPARAIAALHAPTPGAAYAAGWARTEIDGADVSFHLGGTGAFLAVAAIVHGGNRAITVQLNAGGAAAQSAAVDAVRRFIAEDE